MTVDKKIGYDTFGDRFSVLTHKIIVHRVINSLSTAHRVVI